MIFSCYTEIKGDITLFVSFAILYKDIFLSLVFLLLRVLYPRNQQNLMNVWAVNKNMFFRTKAKKSLSLLLFRKILRF